MILAARASRLTCAFDPIASVVAIEKGSPLPRGQTRADCTRYFTQASARDLAARNRDCVRGARHNAAHLVSQIEDSFTETTHNPLHIPFRRHKANGQDQETL